MRRELYEVYAKIVDAKGNYNTLNGYPKVFDSQSYENDCEKAKQRAYAAYYGALSSMLAIDTRQCQFAMLIRGNDGMQIEMKYFGRIADLPDPEPEIPEESETPEEPEGKTEDPSEQGDGEQ